MSKILKGGRVCVAGGPERAPAVCNGPHGAFAFQTPPGGAGAFPCAAPLCALDRAPGCAPVRALDRASKAQSAATSRSKRTGRRFRSPRATHRGVDRRAESSLPGGVDSSLDSGVVRILSRPSQRPAPTNQIGPISSGQSHLTNRNASCTLIRLLFRKGNERMLSVIVVLRRHAEQREASLLSYAA